MSKVLEVQLGVQLMTKVEMGAVLLYDWHGIQE